MLVYHFTTSQFGLSNIALNRLKVARFSDLNDPFELLPVDVANKDLRVGIRAKKQAIDESEGLICFCRDWHDPLLWSHYGDKHRGMCLVFDVPDRRLHSIRYVKGLHKINVLSPSVKQAAIDRLLGRLRYTKFQGWSYENEIRLLVDLRPLQTQSGLYFLPFSKELALNKIILGPRSDLPIAEVRKLVSLFNPNVQVISSRIAFTKFAVVEKK